MRRIGDLYAIEHKAASMTAAERLQLRQTQAVPALVGLHARLQAMQKTVAPGSGTGKAIEHAIKRWPALVRYAD